MTTPAHTRGAIALLVIGATLVSLIGWHCDRLRYAPEDSDGVKYIQAARHLLDGRGLVHSMHAAEAPWGEVWEPLRNWPPGYSLLVAGLSKVTGIDPTPTAVWITRAFWAAVPALLLLCLAPLRLGIWAAPVSLLSAFSIGFLNSGTVPRSDPPFFVLVCGTLLLLKAFLATDRPRWLFAAAVTAGLSYTVRTIGLSVILAVPAALLLTRVATHGRNASRRVARDLMIWTAGAAIPIIPLLARNVALFGQLQPYSLPPSTMSFFYNVRWLVSATISEITGYWYVGPWVAWNWLPALLACLGFALIAAVFCRTRLIGPMAAASSDAAYVITLVLYALASAVLLVLGRTTYQWGDLINERYVSQFAWIVTALVLCALLDLFPSGRRRLGLEVVLLVACLAAVVGRIGAVGRIQADHSRVVASDTRLVQELRTWASRGDVVVSDSGPLLSLIADVNVRKIYPVSTEDCENFDAALSRLVNEPPLRHVRLHAVMVGPHRCEAAAGAAEPPWQVERSTPAYLVLTAPSR